MYRTPETNSDTNQNMEIDFYFFSHCIHMTFYFSFIFPSYIIAHNCV